jgi:hypothetical protein
MGEPAGVLGGRPPGGAVLLPGAMAWLEHHYVFSRQGVSVDPRTADASNVQTMNWSAHP